MEYPRLGLIRIESFDHFLVDAHQQMQARDMSERSAPEDERSRCA
jgi:hypothetical protein